MKKNPNTGSSAIVALSLRAYQANANGTIPWDIAALRRELARLGFDWRDEDPSGSFALRQP
jgi:hypothetical protein